MNANKDNSTARLERNTKEIRKMRIILISLLVIIVSSFIAYWPFIVGSAFSFAYGEIGIGIGYIFGILGLIVFDIFLTKIILKTYKKVKELKGDIEKKEG